MIIHGINEDSAEDSDKIISATSSTTQAFGLMLRILDNHFSVKKAMMTTVHAYTADQPLTDAIGLDLRRSRSAVENIIPNTTSAPRIIEKLMPEFKDKLDGIAFNVPVPNGSCVDMTTELEKAPSPEEVNEVLKEASTGKYKDFIGYTDDPIVSSDVIGREETMVFDAKATMVTADNLLKTLCWYDNGWGFSKRILETRTFFICFLGFAFFLLIFGLVLSIILMATAATLISKWIKEYKWIAWVGLFAILFVAVELIYTDLKLFI